MKPKSLFYDSEWCFALLAVCAIYCVLIATIGIPSIGLGVDEVQYVSRSWQIASGKFGWGESNLNYGPGWYWMLGHWQNFCGRDLYVIRTLPATLGLLTLLNTYLLSRYLAGPKVGVFGAALLAVNPLFISYHSVAMTQAPVLFFFTITLLICVMGRKMSWQKQALLFSLGFCLMLSVRGHMIVSLPVFLALIWWLRDDSRITAGLGTGLIAILLLGLFLMSLPDRTVLDITAGLGLDSPLEKMGIVDVRPSVDLAGGHIPAMKTYFSEFWYYKWLIIEIIRNPSAWVFLSQAIVCAVACLFFLLKKERSKFQVGALLLGMGYLYLSAGHYLYSLSGGASRVIPYSVFFHSAQIPVIAMFLSGIYKKEPIIFGRTLAIVLIIASMISTIPSYVSAGSGVNKNKHSRQVLADLSDEFSRRKKPAQDALYIGFDRPTLLALSYADVWLKQISHNPRYSKSVAGTTTTIGSESYEEIEKRHAWTDAHLWSWIHKDIDTVIIHSSARNHCLNLGGCEGGKPYEKGNIFPEWAFEMVSLYFVCEQIKVRGAEPVSWCERRTRGSTN
jgi:4-amino-4-deoxy-L-arabinose transferase-like glycosyltransferase